MKCVRSVEKELEAIWTEHPVRVVLFDLDGVVVLTDRYHYLAWKRLADEQGWAFDESVNNRCRGISRLASLRVILTHNELTLDRAEMERLANQKNVYYRESLAQMSARDLCSGVVAFFETLSAVGVRLAVCSSSRNARHVLDALQLTPFFEAILTGNDVAALKPHPEIFQKAAALLRVSPAECLVFEDAQSGVAAAHAAQMRCIGVGEAAQLPAAAICIPDFLPINRLICRAARAEE